jgi:formylglycine-generating enzyme required for sulfatase activity
MKHLVIFILFTLPVILSFAGESQQTTPNESFRDKIIDGPDGPEMVWIPAGKFLMGDIQGIGLKDEVPVHEVEIKQRFAIGKYPVTFSEYDLFCEATGRKKPDDRGWGRGRQPVILVSWLDAIAYTQWLSQETSKQYRLPTEAEWEHAARAGTKTSYWWGDNMKPGMANCDQCNDKTTKPRPVTVGRFKPNAFGLYDALGNVFEWTASKWTKTFNGEELKQINNDEVQLLANYLNAAQIAMRGGTWNLGAKFNRSSSRYYGSPQSTSTNLGFRVVRSE